MNTRKEYTLWRAERELQMLTEAQATILWVERGLNKGVDAERMKNDWYDAKRNIAFMLADEIVEACAQGMVLQIPPYYFPYLHNISLEEYKQLKAYLAWEGSGKSGDSLKYYYGICERLNGILSGSEVRNLPLATFREYLKDSLMLKEKIKRRKAFWQFLGNKEDYRVHWEAANNFVETVYRGLLYALGTKSQPEFARVRDYVFPRSHLMNMMEFFIFSFCLV